MVTVIRLRSNVQTHDSMRTNFNETSALLRQKGKSEASGQGRLGGAGDLFAILARLPIFSSRVFKNFRQRVPSCHPSPDASIFTGRIRAFFFPLSVTAILNLSSVSV